jgi:hypothetical protein
MGRIAEDATLTGRGRQVFSMFSFLAARRTVFGKSLPVALMKSDLAAREIDSAATLQILIARFFGPYLFDDA